MSIFDLSAIENNLKVAYKWTKKLFSLAVKNRAVRLTIVLVIIIGIQFSGPYFALSITQSTLEKNIEHSDLRSKNIEKTSLLYARDTISACIDSQFKDLDNTLRYCKRAKTFYEQIAANNHYLKNDYKDVMKYSEYLTMKMDIQLLINNIDEDFANQQYPIEKIPQYAFAFSVWYAALTGLLSLILVLAFLSATGRHKSSETTSEEAS